MDSVEAYSKVYGRSQINNEITGIYDQDLLVKRRNFWCLIFLCCLLKLCVESGREGDGQDLIYLTECNHNDCGRCCIESYIVLLTQIGIIAPQPFEKVANGIDAQRTDQEGQKVK